MNYVKTAMLLAAMTALFMGVGAMIGGQSGMMIAFVVAIGTNLFAFWNSDKMALRMHNAHEVGPQHALELYRMVEQLAANAQMPMPRVYLIESDQPNAFATGRSPERAAVAATTGIMQALTYDELAGVMAHELAHIKNRDTLIMTMAATIAGAISMLAQFGMFFGGSDNRNNPLGFVGVILAALLAPFAAMLIQMFISRTREYSADKLGAQICGDPMALASALDKIAGAAKRRPMDSAERNPATAHMFIVNPLNGQRMDSLFSTHPNTDNRIAALQDLARQMGGARSVARPSPRRSGPGASGPWG